jgi:hypothetical protein
MSKRFFDSDKWKKKWFRLLSTAEKAAWDYITSQCDSVGVWEPDYETAEHFINGKVDWKGFTKKVNGNIEILTNGKWFLVDFCHFQYGRLKPSCSPHRSYIALLEKHGLFERVAEGYAKGCLRDKEKEQEKDKEKEKELELEKEEEEEKEKDRRAQAAREFARLKKENAPCLVRGHR